MAPASARPLDTRAEPSPPRLCGRRQLKPRSASLRPPLLFHLISFARHSTIGTSEGEKETPPSRDHERCPPPKKVSWTAQELTFLKKVHLRGSFSNPPARPQKTNIQLISLRLKRRNYENSKGIFSIGLWRRIKPPKISFIHDWFVSSLPTLGLFLLPYYLRNIRGTMYQTKDNACKLTDPKCRLEIWGISSSFHF